MSSPTRTTSRAGGGASKTARSSRTTNRPPGKSRPKTRKALKTAKTRRAPKTAKTRKAPKTKKAPRDAKTGKVPKDARKRTRRVSSRRTARKPAAAPGGGARAAATANGGRVRVSRRQAGAVPPVPPHGGAHHDQRSANHKWWRWSDGPAVPHRTGRRHRHHPGQGTRHRCVRAGVAGRHRTADHRRACRGGER